MGTVLVVDDEKGLREGLTRALQGAGHTAFGASGIAEAKSLLKECEVDCVLLDVRLKDGDGIEFLEEMRAGLAPEVPVVMATAFGDSERTIRAMRAGAFDYATKPFDLPALLDTVARAVRQRELDQGVTASKPEAPPSDADTLVGTSPAMLQVWKLIGRAAGSDAPVLITGETGTGKERVARAIHAHSARAAGPFVAVNLAALPETLLESELFGHEKGAFTGAAQRKPGRLELAAGGTLFLDEIGDLDAGLQTRLLRVLQDGHWERVGGTETLTLRARVMAATHRAVRPGSQGAAIRDDLYYRLAVIEMELPPLRARRSDIPLLVAHALRGTRARAVSEEAMEKLQGYLWPGTVRELLHVLARAAVMCSGEVIDVHDLPDALGRSVTVGPHGAAANPYEGMTMKAAVAALEKSMIVSALAQAKGNRAEAARILGIARPQLYSKMDEHGMASRKE
ncbi:MAG: sigma-54 dependent transcriptional regulator [Polyangiales bacterium]